MERVISVFTEASSLKAAVAAADIGRGTGGVYVMNIGTKQSKGLNACCINCISDGIQSSSTFFGRVVLADMDENGAFEKADEELKTSRIVGLPAGFANVVDTLSSTSDNLFLTIKEKEVIIQTKTSKVPLPIVDRPPVNRIPEAKKKIVFEVKREDLLNVLRAANVGVSYEMDASKPKAFNLRPTCTELNAVLEVMGASSFVVAMGDVAITGTSSTYEADVEKLDFVAVKAEKLMKIVSVTSAEKVRFTFLVVESDGKEIVDTCMIQCGSSVKYYLKTYSEAIHASVKERFGTYFDSCIYKVSALTADIRTALDVICVTSEKPKNVQARFDVESVKGADMLVISDFAGRNVANVENIVLEGEFSESIYCNAGIFGRSVGAFEFGKKDGDVKVNISLTQGGSGNIITMSCEDSTVRLIVSTAAGEESDDSENTNDKEE